VGGDFLKGIFYSTLFNTASPASPSSVAEDAGIESRTVATLALACRRSNHLARSHPQLGRSHSLEIASFVVFALLNPTGFYVYCRLIFLSFKIISFYRNKSAVEVNRLVAFRDGLQRLEGGVANLKGKGCYV
jgi:hypothetical protein